MMDGVGLAIDLGGFTISSDDDWKKWVCPCLCLRKQPGGKESDVGSKRKLGRG